MRFLTWLCFLVSRVHLLRWGTVRAKQSWSRGRRWVNGVLSKPLELFWEEPKIEPDKCEVPWEMEQETRRRTQLGRTMNAVQEARFADEEWWQNLSCTWRTAQERWEMSRRLSGQVKGKGKCLWKWKEGAWEKCKCRCWWSLAAIWKSSVQFQSISYLHYWPNPIFPVLPYTSFLVLPSQLTCRVCNFMNMRASVFYVLPLRYFFIWNALVPLIKSCWAWNGRTGFW